MYEYIDKSYLRKYAPQTRALDLDTSIDASATQLYASLVMYETTLRIRKKQDEVLFSCKYYVR